MHVILVGPIYYGYSESVFSALVKLECEVDFFPIREFYTNCSYLQRKIYKIGMTSLKKKWNENWEKQLIEFIKCHANDKSILIFLTGDMVSERLLNSLGKYKKILIMWDSIKRYKKEFQDLIKLYDYAFAFEYSDIEYAKNILGTKMEYMPLGYDSDYYYPRKDVIKDIDVSFVGSAIPSRLELLEGVATYCENENVNLYTGGVWFAETYRKRCKFAKRYPNLVKFHDNRMLSQADVADIYRRSKICLNINNCVHKSISPRTLEIMATKSFQLMNEGQSFSGLNYGDKLKECIVTYDSDEKLIEQIKYYLKEDIARRDKAIIGYNYALNYSNVEVMRKIMRTIGRK